MDATGQQRAARERLIEIRAHGLKLANAQESGRIYGMRQQRYDVVLRRRLSQEWRHPPVEGDWADDDSEDDSESDAEARVMSLKAKGDESDTKRGGYSKWRCRLRVGSAPTA